MSEEGSSIYFRILTAFADDVALYYSNNDRERWTFNLIFRSDFNFDDGSAGSENAWQTREDGVNAEERDVTSGKEECVFTELTQMTLPPALLDQIVLF